MGEPFSRNLSPRQPTHHKLLFNTSVSLELSAKFLESPLFSLKSLRSYSNTNLSFHATDNAGRPNRNFPLDLLENMNPAFTEGLCKYFPISQTCQEEQMKIFTFYIGLFLATCLYPSGTLR